MKDLGEGVGDTVITRTQKGGPAPSTEPAAPTEPTP